jgi:hypothetical protein
MNMHLRTITLSICILATMFCMASADQAVKPKLKVALDGFPSGHDTPEGAACDLARAFIKRDASLFTSACIQPSGSGKSRDDYEAFLKTTTESIKQEATKAEPSPGGPKAIGKVFAARHPTMNGPASTGYAVFGYLDVMFVDVGVFLQNGGRVLNRTLVIKDGNGKWYVDPDPAADPLLSMGLNKESPSQHDFSEVYDIQK